MIFLDLGERMANSLPEECYISSELIIGID